MSASIRVISIGTMASNPHWGERGALRPAHATTSLIVAGSAKILVDPSLLTHVFLTCLNPIHRRGLLAFDKAQWLVAEREREAIGVQLVASLKEAHDAGDHDLAKTLSHEVAVIQRTVAAPDKLATGVDLFPLYGVTPGLCGLLLPSAGATTLLAGDAVPTVEHLDAGQVMSPCFDLEAARESFSEAVEIADWIVCGRDNMVPNLSRRM
ncbi:MAG: hypothetical protein RLZZ116_2 [Planctomycetota bacterium]|jgi:glyoxylase-like metal-dependent hydrolase (beta-lactamase superfamily II)